MIMNLHTHTHHSPDADDTVAERVKIAQELGLQYMAITDHCEINRFEPAAFYGAEESEMFFYNSRRVTEGSLAETTAAKADCGNLKLLCGIELGQIPQDVQLSRQVYHDPRLDLVIGSVHELPNLPDFYFLDYKSVDIPSILKMYFEEVLALAETDCYDVLGHITYGLRYLPNRASIDISPYLPIIIAIYKTVIRKGKALELNGSGLKKEPSFTDPNLALLRLYHDLGGELLTISTDAHAGKYLGCGVDTLEQMARDAGFCKLTYFERHCPVQIDLLPAAR